MLGLLALHSKLRGASCASRQARCMTTDILVQLRADGSARQKGVTHLYREFASRFRSFFRRHQIEDAAAEDLVQETFIRIVRGCDGFRGDSPFEAWLWSIARNCMLDHFRRGQPTVNMDHDAIDALADTDCNLQVQPNPPGENLEDCVQEGFGRFADVHRSRAEALRLVTFEGWDMNALAAFLERTPAATREYVSQCRKKLRAFLEDCEDFLAEPGR